MNEKFKKPKGHNCHVSTGICDRTTFGHGKLDEYGYWEHPCEVCARAWERQYGKEYNSCWPATPISIVDYFDIHKEEHLRAWKHLQEKGSWPDDFLPYGVVFPNLWQVTIMSKMASGWVDRYLEIYDSCPKKICSYCNKEDVHRTFPGGGICKSCDEKLEKAAKDGK